MHCNHEAATMLVKLHSKRQSIPLEVQTTAVHHVVVLSEIVVISAE